VQLTLFAAAAVQYSVHRPTLKKRIFEYQIWYSNSTQYSNIRIFVYILSFKPIAKHVYSCLSTYIRTVKLVSIYKIARGHCTVSKCEKSKTILKKIYSQQLISEFWASSVIDSWRNRYWFSVKGSSDGLFDFFIYSRFFLI
jgi:hypothetical protein